MFPLKFIDSNVSEELIDLINLEMTYSKLQDKLIEFKFNKESDPTLIEQLKFDIQIWREQSTTVINSYFESPQEHECLVAINYYYFLIELNEVSARKSLPLIHSFHSFSFALLMNYSESGFEKLSQVNVRLALHSLFWYQKLFKVVEYCLTCVKVDINTPRSISSNLDFMNKFFTLENMVKLLTYISNQKRNYCPSKIEFFLYNLSLLVKKMATYLANYNAFDRNEINQEIDKTIDKLFRKKVHRE